jgi:hypothetical protein
MTRTLRLGLDVRHRKPNPVSAQDIVGSIVAAGMRLGLRVNIVDSTELGTPPRLVVAGNQLKKVVDAQVT